MNDISIKIINNSSNPLPAYATSGSSGMDVRANIPEAIVLKPLQRVLIPTGLLIELPENFEMQIRPRSGLALNHGITCLNTPGTIDADYRGEIKVILINLSDEMQEIKPGERIAQLVLNTVQKTKWIEAETIEKSNRGQNGFGHSGKH